MYLMTGSRPDLSFPVSHFGKFQNCHDTIHIKHLKHVFMADLTVQLLMHLSMLILPMTHMTGKVQQVLFITVFGNNVIWKSKKKPCVSLSSTGSEYIALVSAAAECMLVGKLLVEIIGVSDVQFVLFEDNQSCIKMASTFETKRSKHLSVKHHIVKDLAQHKVLKLVYVDTHNQVADVLTKALPYSKFQFCVTGLVYVKIGERC
ncbi:hypothetical protein PR048_025596 [Dryococelus australis]|uniref:Polyprotein n=1 Tax=Dryococelus australis TaxID=614101 RepID=A0ABQ9GRS7_9NEOP|nr:hypothetical protein PR048_025596 [Dryococelus australis]